VAKLVGHRAVHSPGRDSGAADHPPAHRLHLARSKAELETIVAERTNLLNARNEELTRAMASIKQLTGLLHVCAKCKKSGTTRILEQSGNLYPYPHRRQFHPQHLPMLHERTVPEFFKEEPDSE
jgi:hypothetical protein